MQEHETSISPVSVTWETLAADLEALPEGSAQNPATIKFAPFTFSTMETPQDNAVGWGEVNTVIENAQKYVLLDLSACTAEGNTITGGDDPPHGMYLIKDNKYIKGFILPSSLETIGDNAFSHTNLSSVIIGDSVTSIGESAFAFCTALTSITIPNSVTSIGYSAFEYCFSLTSITIPYGVTSIEGFTFYNCEALASVFIPDSVAVIKGNAFCACPNLTSITIPGGVTSIRKCAFEGCRRLTSITIPNSVSSIGKYAFRGCSRLTNIKVDSANTMYTSDAGVLFNKNKTTLIQYPSGKSETSYTIPDSVTEIGDGAFNGCKQLTSVIIPDSVNFIREAAFCSCTSLESVTIPGSVSSIGDYAFFCCFCLTDIEVAFANIAYTSDTGVLFNKNKTVLIQYPSKKRGILYTIPDSVTDIGDRAFIRCDQLTSVVIPDSVISIGERAFEDCSGLTSVNFAGSDVKFKKNAYRYRDSAYIDVLRTAYKAGGAGVYTRTAGENDWVKASG